MRPLTSFREVGERLRQTRTGAGLTQTELALRARIERTALVRAEAGDRQLSALELWALADALGVSLEHLLSSSPPPLVEHRTAAADELSVAADRTRFRLDASLEQHARDARQLVASGVLVAHPRPDLGSAGDPGEGRTRARMLRDKLHLGQDPLPPLVGLAEQVGLFLLGVDLDADGACLTVDDWGVAVVGGAEPGRRRSSGAHELGHFVLGDTYSADAGVAAAADERERTVDAFAAEFLLPAGVVTDMLTGSDGPGDRRAALVRVSARWRTSWSVAVAAAFAAGLVGPAERAGLLARVPDRVELLQTVGEEPQPDVLPGSTGPQWRRAVLDALEQHQITAARAAELLHGAVTGRELADR